ncbi:ABC transporter ATP-binding protein [Streptococcus pneumoniae]|nr:ABC transporter ATP-binding protein [Streptococcus pneumoniae]
MRTTNDITQVQMLITMDLQVVTCGPIMAIWAIGKILGHSEYWLWAVLVAVIVNVLMTTVLMTLAFPKQPFEFVCQPSYGYFESYHDGDFKWFECGDLLDWGLCD